MRKTVIIGISWNLIEKDKDGPLEREQGKRLWFLPYTTMIASINDNSVSFLLPNEFFK